MRTQLPTQLSPIGTETMELPSLQHTVTLSSHGTSSASCQGDFSSNVPETRIDLLWAPVCVSSDPYGGRRRGGW